MLRQFIPGPLTLVDHHDVLVNVASYNQHSEKIKIDHHSREPLTHPVFILDVWLRGRYTRIEHQITVMLDGDRWAWLDRDPGIEFPLAEYVIRTNHCLELTRADRVLIEQMVHRWSVSLLGVGPNDQQVLDAIPAPTAPRFDLSQLRGPYGVILDRKPHTRKIHLVKIVKHATGMNLRYCKGLVENPPAIILDALERDSALSLIHEIDTIVGQGLVKLVEVQGEASCPS
jgi:hypothetical protein